MSRRSRPLKLLPVLALFTAFVAPVWPQMALPPPVPPGVAPAWTRVPTSPQVFYAPNVPADLFLLHKRYYYYYGVIGTRASTWQDRGARCASRTCPVPDKPHLF